VAAPHGLKGELRCDIVTDFPERFRRTKQLHLGTEHRPYDVERTRAARGQLVLKLAGVDSRSDAERLRGQLICVPSAEAVKLPRGSYFWHQIIGLRVETIDKMLLGTVVDILQTGSNDVYVVKTETGELLIPAIKDVVRKVDVESGVMTVDLMEGLA